MEVFIYLFLPRGKLWATCWHWLGIQGTPEKWKIATKYVQYGKAKGTNKLRTGERIDSINTTIPAGLIGDIG
jgi:hypothetical protein